MTASVETDRSKIWLAVSIAVSLLHFAWLTSYVVSGFVGPDADGYYGQAGMIVHEGRTTFEVESPAQYLGMHWLEKDDGGFVSRYPPGLPAVFAAAWVTLGRDAVFYVNPAMASLTVFFIFLLLRRWVGPGPAVASAVVQAFHAEANGQALAAMSHTATGFFLIGGLAILDRWSKNGSRIAALPAGLMLGMVPSVRYAEAAAVVGIVAFLWYQIRRPEGRLGVLWVAAGAIVPVGWMLVRNQAEFGAFWRTAYYLTGESSLSFEYFLRNWPSYLLAPLESGMGVFYALGIIGLLLMIRETDTRPIAVAVGLVIASITLVYTC